MFFVVEPKTVFQGFLRFAWGGEKKTFCVTFSLEEGLAFFSSPCREARLLRFCFTGSREKARSFTLFRPSRECYGVLSVSQEEEDNSDRAFSRGVKKTSLFFSFEKNFCANMKDLSMENGEEEEEVLPLLIPPCYSSSTTAAIAHPPPSVCTPGESRQAVFSSSSSRCASPVFPLSPPSFSSSLCYSENVHFNVGEEASSVSRDQAKRLPSSCSKSQKQTDFYGYSKGGGGGGTKRRIDIEKDDEVDGEDDHLTPSSLTKKFGVYIHQTLIHPPAVSPFSLSLPPLSDQESPSDDIFSSFCSSSFSSCRFLGLVSSIYRSSRKMFLQSTSYLLSGLSFRGCLYEMTGTFLLTFLVHLVFSSLQASEGPVDPTLHNLQEQKRRSSETFNGWGLATRLPLLLYCVGALFGKTQTSSSAS